MMRRLFIQDTESPRTIPKLLPVILGVFICLIVIDRAFGLILPRLTIEPPFILRLQNVQGVERLWAFSDAGVSPIVFTGSSQIHMGMSPHIFNDRIKAVSGNSVNSVDISIWDGVITAQRDLIRNFILPNHPQIMIYGIEMRALLPAAQEPNSEGLEDFRNKALGYAVSTQSAIERNVLLWLLRHSNLVQYRDNMREWLTGRREINQLGYPPEQVDDLGHFSNPTIYTRDPVLIKGYFTPFSANDYTRQTIADIGTTCKQDGVQCILLNMPIHEMAYQYITNKDQTIYNELLRLAGLPIWDFNTQQCRELLGDKSYFDIIHLNESGSEVFSKMVADVYAKTFFNVDFTGDANCAVLSP